MELIVMGRPYLSVTYGRAVERFELGLMCHKTLARVKKLELRRIARHIRASMSAGLAD